jgi:Na+-transporting methylmalonyl-CoA/oxaloacetate decarboxylase gamma subunit
MGYVIAVLFIIVVYALWILGIVRHYKKEEGKDNGTTHTKYN